MNYISVAIDGPSGAGKSTMAKRLAAELGYVYVDTGAMYRAVGLYIMRKGINLEDKETIIRELPGIIVTIGYENGTQHVYLNEEDVSGLIRTEEVGKYASSCSAIPEVRAHLLELQRNMGKTNNIIMDGRDIGTVVLPDATVKIFLVASLEKRAKRRYDELIAKGENVSYEETYKQMEQRDFNDMNRAVAPLKPAEDAVHADTSDLGIEESYALLKKIIMEKTKDVL
ncbi:MAG: (d)CMP kinase [Clostridia bacterium]|nr:(d)CMP kinase [Clostridia bacterium]